MELPMRSTVQVAGIKIIPMYRIFLLIVCILLSCSGHKHYDNPHILIETQFGDIEVELFSDKAPKTVIAFLSGVDSGMYEHSSFYRVLKAEDQPSSGFKTELIQGGIWYTNSAKAEKLHGIIHESTKQTGLSHTDGTISLARATPGTASSEFFIVVGDQKEYDYGSKINPDGQGYAAFGRVFKGMDIVRKIHAQPNYEESLTPVVEILRIVRL